MGGKRDYIPTFSPPSAEVASENVADGSIPMTTRKRSRKSTAETENNIVIPGSANHNVASVL